MVKTAPFIVCLAVLLQGCATPKSAPPDAVKAFVGSTVGLGLPDQASPKVAQPSPAKIAHESLSASIKVTPLMHLQDASSACSGTCRPAFAGKYTRLVLVGELPILAGSSVIDQTAEIAAYNKRDPVARFLMSKASGISLVAHISVPGTLKTVAPLVSLSRISNSDGESWTRELVLEKKATPHFLVKDDGSNSSVSVVFEAKASDNYASRGLAVGVSALSKLASTAGVNPPLITALNKDSVRNLATELDSAISRLLATSITEKVEADRSLIGWGTEKGKGLSLSFRVPKDLEGTDMREDNLRTVGTWHVYFEPPRPSIFVDQVICPTTTSIGCLIEENVDTAVGQKANLASVLSYPVGGSGDIQRTVKSHMRQTEWWATTMRDWAAATPTLRTQVITGFCKQVVSEASELGFSGVDARLILAAIIELVPLPAESEQMRTSCAAISLRVRPPDAGT